jgi:hypothetical protein
MRQIWRDKQMRKKHQMRTLLAQEVAEAEKRAAVLKNAKI